MIYILYYINDHKSSLEKNNVWIVQYCYNFTKFYQILCFYQNLPSPLPKLGKTISIEKSIRYEIIRSHFARFYQLTKQNRVSAWRFYFICFFF